MSAGPVIDPAAADDLIRAARVVGLTIRAALPDGPPPSLAAAFDRAVSAMDELVEAIEPDAIAPGHVGGLAEISVLLRTAAAGLRRLDGGADPGPADAIELLAADQAIHRALVAVESMRLAG